jgi:hypothetical protein
MLAFDLRIDGGVGFSFNNRPSFSGIVKSAQANKQVNHICQNVTNGAQKKAYG